MTVPQIADSLVSDDFFRPWKNGSMDCGVNRKGWLPWDSSAVGSGPQGPEGIPQSAYGRGDSTVVINGAGGEFVSKVAAAIASLGPGISFGPGSAEASSAGGPATAVAGTGLKRSGAGPTEGRYAAAHANWVMMNKALAARNARQRFRAGAEWKINSFT